MIKLILATTATMILVVSCGSGSDSNGDKKNKDGTYNLISCLSPSKETSGTLKGDGANWTVKYNWTVGPVAGVEEPAESRLELLFKTYNKRTPISVENVTFEARTKDVTLQRGPEITIGRSGAVSVRPIYFYSPGDWAMTIAAAVDQVPDQVTFCMRVNE